MERPKGAKGPKRHCTIKLYILHIRCPPRVHRCLRCFGVEGGTVCEVTAIVGVAESSEEQQRLTCYYKRAKGSKRHRHIKLYTLHIRCPLIVHRCFRCPRVGEGTLHRLINHCCLLSVSGCLRCLGVGGGTFYRLIAHCCPLVVHGCLRCLGEGGGTVCTLNP